MENALYYTLSTAAQALGGASALMGAFVLVRLQAPLLALGAGLCRRTRTQGGTKNPEPLTLGIQTRTSWY